jgi:hypothetical protein
MGCPSGGAEAAKASAANGKAANPEKTSRLVIMKILPPGWTQRELSVGGLNQLQSASKEAGYAF